MTRTEKPIKIGKYFSSDKSDNDGLAQKIPPTMKRDNYIGIVCQEQIANKLTMLSKVIMPIGKILYYLTFLKPRPSTSRVLIAKAKACGSILLSNLLKGDI